MPHSDPAAAVPTARTPPRPAPRAPAQGPAVAASGVDLGELAGLVGYRLRRAQLAVIADFVAALGSLDLRPVTFSVLSVVDANPGLSQAAVGDALGIQRANFVPLAGELEGRGLVERTPSPTDRRSHALNLTAEGRRLLMRARVAVNAHEARITARLGAKRRLQLLALLAEITVLPCPAPNT